jgi:hypothetical protein
MTMDPKLGAVAVLTAAAVTAVLIGVAPTYADASPSGQPARSIRVRVQPRVVEYRPFRVSLAGVTAAAVSVRLRGADDPNGLAYRWTPYRWHRLRLIHGGWRGVLPVPPLRGIYQVQFRVRHSTRLLQSPRWLLRVLPPGTLKRSGFQTPQAVVSNYVRDLPGDQALVAVRSWPQAAFDHRDPRLHRIFVIAYAPRGDKRPSSRLGVFITTVRDGYHGRWRLLEATQGPPD